MDGRMRGMKQGWMEMIIMFGVRNTDGQPPPWMPPEKFVPRPRAGPLASKKALPGFGGTTAANRSTFATFENPPQIINSEACI